MDISNFENVSNLLDTNIFESYTGAIPLANTKLSGNYKVVVMLDGTLYLDDYNNRRVVLDKNQNFLNQVTNFLRIETNPYDLQKLKYGVNNEVIDGKNKLFYHAPIYINNPDTIPELFVISQLRNGELTNTDLYKGNINTLYNLENIGIKKIFTDISNYKDIDYPVYLSLEDANYKIFGYSYEADCFVEKQVDILNSLANQNYLDVFNNNILNSFPKNKIIFPKFLNVEFEFSYLNNNVLFNNFFGFYGNQKEINISEFNSNKYNISTKTFYNKFEYKQIFDSKNYVEESYEDIFSNSHIKSVNEKNPQIKFKIFKIAPGESITIFTPDKNIFYQYVVTKEDIKTTFEQTISVIINNFNLKTNYEILIYLEKNNNINFVLNNSDIEGEKYSIKVPNHFEQIDNKLLNPEKYFVSVGYNDIIIKNTLFANNNYVRPEDIEKFKTVKLDGKNYSVEKIFFLDGDMYFRLDEEIIEFDSEIVYLLETKKTVLNEIRNIPWLIFNNNFEIRKQFSKDSFVSELKAKWGNSEDDNVKYALDDFDKITLFSDNYFYFDYLKENDRYLQTPINKLTVENHNLEIIKNQYFNSPGSNLFIAPNLLNIDRSFYGDGGNINIDLLGKDIYRFHWFLIKGKCPDYLLSDIRQLRYFDDIPKLTSRLISTGKIYSNEIHSETVFMGVRYRLPQKFIGYNFAVYLNFNDSEKTNLSYSFDVNDIDKTIYLVLNKYIDFVDLIRGGDSKNEPILDISLLYNIQKSYNTNSNLISTFKTGGVLIADTEIPVMFENKVITDWKQFDVTLNKWLICLKRSTDTVTDNFIDLFDSTLDQNVFYVYSEIEIEGVKYEYLAVTFTIIGIKYISNNYLWCEDIKIKFFDTNKILLNRYNEKLDSDLELYEITKDQINSSKPISEYVFGNYTKEYTIIHDGAGKKIVMFNIDKEFSFREEYFEINKTITFENNIKSEELSFFCFLPESVYADKTLTEMIALFAKNSFDNATRTTKISLFDRNQIWNVLREFAKYQIKFKYSSPTQLRNEFNKLLVGNLMDFTNINSIPIENQIPSNPGIKEYVNMNVIFSDDNVAVWNTYDASGKNLVYTANKISRSRSEYFPYFKQVINEKDFQNDVLYTNKTQENILNIYSKNYGNHILFLKNNSVFDYNINSTGLWKQFLGNVVSSVFTGNNKIEITVNSSELTTIFNQIEILKKYYTVDSAVIIDKNKKYLDTINKNTDTYILDSFIIWILTDIYKLFEIYNEENKKILFTFGTSNQNIINTDSQNTTRNLKFIFIRK